MGPTSSLGGNFIPGGQLHPWGSNFSPGAEVKKQSSDFFRTRNTSAWFRPETSSGGARRQESSISSRENEVGRYFLKLFFILENIFFFIFENLSFSRFFASIGFPDGSCSFHSMLTYELSSVCLLKNSFLLITCN
jgi:hypothetical protein